MDLNELEEQITELITAIPDGQVSLRDSEKFAIDFNTAKNHLASVEKTLRSNRADMNVELSVRKAYAYRIAEGTSVPEKKLNADADREYLEIKRDIEKLSGDIVYIERTLKICEDFHTHFRKFCG